MYYPNPFFLLFLLLIFLWLRTDPEETSSEDQQYQLATWLNVTRYETQQLVSSKLGTALETLNLTGITNAVNQSYLNPFIPAELTAQIQDFWEIKSDDSVYFTNISSILHGKYSSGQVSARPLNLSRYNETIEQDPPDLGPNGKIQINFAESYRLDSAAFIRASLFYNTDAAQLYGVYLSTGHVIAATKSLKFSGTKALPFISPPLPEGGLEDTQRLLEGLIANDTKEYSWPDFQERLATAGNCEWVMYGRTHPVPLSPDQMHDIEDELANPIGRPAPKLPPVGFKGVAFSPDCGLSMSLHTKGDRVEAFRVRLRHGLVMILALFIALYSLTILQVQHTSTPTATYRISFWTMALATLPDGLVCMVCMVSTFEKAFALQLMAIVVVVFCFITTVQIDFLISIFQSQLGEGMSPSDLTYVQISAMINSRMYITIVVLCLLLISSYGFSDWNRKIIEWAVLFILFSNWWPQIYRSARRGFSKPFLLKYVYGSSILRLLPILYMCFYTHNVGYHHYDPELGWFLLGWQWLQVMLITAQYYLGGQFFVPNSFVIDSHDYHPILSTDLEALLHTSELEVQEGEEQGYKQVDCPICMNPVQLDVSQGNSAASVLARRKYMITPCRHVFHTPCLQEWMERKLECPVCRTALPST